MANFFPVYLIVSQGGGPQDHHAIFVETDNSQGTGIILQVVGNIQQGMAYERKVSERPEASLTYMSKKLLGRIPTSDLERMEEVCRANPAPEKQFEGPRRLKIGEPLRRCQEWTRETVDALCAQGILIEDD